MSTESKLHQGSDLNAPSDEEQDRHDPKKIACVKIVCVCALLALLIASIPVIYIIWIKIVVPRCQIRFSIVSTSIVTELDPDDDTLSSPPEFRIVFLAEKASLDSYETHFCHSYTDFSYNDVAVSTTVDNLMSSTCYDTEESNEFELLIPLYREDQLRNLGETFWVEEETIVFNLTMHFDANFQLPSNIYTVSCTNLRLGAPQWPVPCEVSMT